MGAAQRPRDQRRSSNLADQPRGRPTVWRSRPSGEAPISETVPAESSNAPQPSRRNPPRLPPQVISDIILNRDHNESLLDKGISPGPSTTLSVKSAASVASDDMGGIVTTRFKHVVTDDGHAIITGRDGDDLQRCEDEPIHIPGAIQSFGLLIALQEQDSKYIVRVVSENSKAIIGYSPRQLFALESFTDILSDEQADNLMDHIDFIREEDSDVETNGPELFTMAIRPPKMKINKLWCAMHINSRLPDLIICEFELEDDTTNPLVSPNEMTPDIPEDTLDSNPTDQEFLESTQNISRPLRVLRSARKRKGEAAAMEVFNIMSQVQEQLAAAPSLETFLKVLVGVVKELTGFHRVMIYQFDKTFNGRVVTELVDPRATKDLYKGLSFPASDIPKQARDLYKINRVRMLYDRDQETARLVCRTVDDLQTPLDLTHSFLRAISPIHLKYLANMAVRSSMSISINAFDELWGLISCHGYGANGMRVSFPIRKMCRLVGDTASRSIERLSYASRLQARKLIITTSSQHNPSGYIVASSEDLLRLFNADFGLLCIQDQTKILGTLEQSQEALAMLEYLKVRRLTSVTTTQDIRVDFPDLIYPPGFQVLAGLLLVPLSSSGSDFIAFFRRGQLREVKWAGNPYEKVIRGGTRAFLEPRKSFKLWSETVVGKCREWSEEETETAAVLCLVYGKFIEVWRQKEAALQNNQLTRLLLANSAHEFRTPLNAIINYLEIALEGILDTEVREHLVKSHSASKSLIYVINDLLDLTKTEQNTDLLKGEAFDLDVTFREATEHFNGDSKRKNISYSVTKHPGLPKNVIGDQRRVRQAVSNIVANAIKHTSEGEVQVDMYVASRLDSIVHVEVAVQDSGRGMSQKRLDVLFRDLEQIQSDSIQSPLQDEGSSQAAAQSGDEGKTLGLGLAVVARIVKNMNGQLRVKSEEGKGSRFVVMFPFVMSDSELGRISPSQSPGGQTVMQESQKGEITLVDRGMERSGSTASLSRVHRSRSNDSMNSKDSLESMGSGGSHKSQVDRLIEAIQEPHMVESKRGQDLGPGPRSGRPALESRKTYNGPLTPPVKITGSSTHHEPHRSIDIHIPGQQELAHSSVPLKAVKIPDESGVPVPSPVVDRSAVLGEIHDIPDQPATRVLLDASNMNVLVAEDDPVNSRIIKKRLEKLGHGVYLTVNGQECADTYRDRPAFFDVILMDMQVRFILAEM